MEADACITPLPINRKRKFDEISETFEATQNAHVVDVYGIGRTAHALCSHHSPARKVLLRERSFQSSPSPIAAPKSILGSSSTITRNDCMLPDGSIDHADQLNRHLDVQGAERSNVRPRPSLLTLPSEVRDLIWEAFVQGESRVRLMEGDYKNINAWQRSYEEGCKLQRSLAAMSTSSYAFRNQTQRQAAAAEKLYQSFITESSPKAPTKLEWLRDAILANHQLHEEITAAVLRTREISLHTTDCRLHSSGARLEWNFSRAQANCLQNARRLHLLLRDPGELEDIAERLGVRIDSHLQSLHVSFWGLANEVTFNDPTVLFHEEYRHMLDNALEKLPQLGAENVAFSAVTAFSDGQFRIHFGSWDLEEEVMDPWLRSQLDDVANQMMHNYQLDKHVVLLDDQVTKTSMIAGGEKIEAAPVMGHTHPEDDNAIEASQGENLHRTGQAQIPNAYTPKDHAGDDIEDEGVGDSASGFAHESSLTTDQRNTDFVQEHRDTTMIDVDDTFSDLGACASGVEHMDVDGPLTPLPQQPLMNRKRHVQDDEDQDPDFIEQRPCREHKSPNETLPATRERPHKRPRRKCANYK